MDIKKTTDYDKFQIIKGNRAIWQGHVNRIAEALALDSSTIEYNPILVNEKMEVIDGQHRLEAQKALGLPIYYIVAPNIGLSTVQSLNSNNRNWTPIDYARSYVASGHKNYEVYLELKEKYKLNHNALLSFAALGGLNRKTLSTAFKKGKLKFTDINETKRLLDQIIDAGTIYARLLRSQSMERAFLYMALHPDYDHDRFLRKLELQSYTIPPVSTVPASLSEFERVYNYYTPTRDWIRLSYQTPAEVAELGELADVTP